MTEEEPIDDVKEPEVVEVVASPYTKLPTGKPHVSFSEIRVWQDCSWRHKLQFVDKIDLSKTTSAIDFGTAVHSAHENFIKTRVMNTDIACDAIKKSWEEKKYEDCSVETACKQAVEALNEIPAYYDEQFPGWEPVDAEHMLYEPVFKYPQYAFKGFIDAIIKVPGRGHLVYWVLDLKSTGWGWMQEKKADFKVQQQLVLYKNFWSRKLNVDMKHIRCGFVLLKRTAKPGNHCELLKVSVGDVTSERALKVLNMCVTAVSKGKAIKNRMSCKYCDYRETEHCP